MGYEISTMVGIDYDYIGVHQKTPSLNEIKQRISKIIGEMRETDFDPDIADDPSHCMSHILEAHKGSYIVIAGTFNHWNFTLSSEFARRLSIEFHTKVMLISWDNQTDIVQCQIFLNGTPTLEHYNLEMNVPLIWW